ncbi:hypothetical protein [Promicromonospora sukumoe]|nr:hypothetical protein [Promicromonospora sukumoe]
MTNPTPRPQNQPTEDAAGSQDRPTEENWLAAAEHIGARDRELLNRLGQ